MQTSSRTKIAVLYPAFLGGGAEAVGLWILEALKDRYDVTLFTVAGVNFERLNAMYGTHLSAESIQIESLFPQARAAFVNACIANNWHVRMALFHTLIRRMKAQRGRFATCVSAYNAVDFGDKGINYIHWINVLDSSKFYNLLSDTRPDRVKQYCNLANSKMVAERVESAYATTPDVLYPPVVIDVQDVAWEAKEFAFICSGRLTLPKEPHKVIEILGRVRDRGFPIKLHLTAGGGGVYAWQYRNRIRKLVAENADWITLHEDLSYADYTDVLAKCRFGIHYKTEPFGISIAEMIKAGAIPFVRSFGGQVEIVGEENKELFFYDPDEAVEKICFVLENEPLQTQLRDAMVTQKNLFSTERFMTEFRQIVAAHLSAEEGNPSELGEAHRPEISPEISPETSTDASVPTEPEPPVPVTV